MKNIRIAVVIAAALAAGLGAQSALAWGHGPRVSFGFNFGIPVGPYPYPYYYPHYYYPAYYPAPVVVQQPPTVYVEQSPPAAQPQPAPAPAAGYWYYCADTHAYYPYVRECPAGWQRVAPQPG